MFFIVGYPRSGTKLIRECLNANGAIYVPPAETEFYLAFKNEFDNCRNLSDEEQVNKLLNYVNKTAYSFYLLEESKITISKDRWLDYIRRDKNQINVQKHFLALLYASNHQDSSHLVLGDKSPSYLAICDLLLSDFPDASFLYLVRDPCDVIDSNARAWGKSKLRCAAKWAEANKELAFKVFNNSRCILLKYEDLITAPDEVVRVAVEFLGVEFNPHWEKNLGVTENLGRAKNVMGIMRNRRESSAHGSADIRTYFIRGLVSDVACQLGYSYRVSKFQILVGKLLYKILSPVLLMFDLFAMFTFDIKRFGIVNGLIFRLRYYANSGKRG